MLHHIESSIPPSYGCPHRFYPSRVSVWSTSSSPAMLRRLGPVVSVSCRALSCCCASWTAGCSLLPELRPLLCAWRLMQRCLHGSIPTLVAAAQRGASDSACGARDAAVVHGTVTVRLPRQKQHGPQRRPAPSCSRAAVRLPDKEERHQQEKHDADFVSLCLQGVRRNSKKTDRELLYQEHPPLNHLTTCALFHVKTIFKHVLLLRWRMIGCQCC